MKKIIIIGAGASGLMLAKQLNEYKKLYDLDICITILEANDKAGKKILASGNGRCNMSNDSIQADDYNHKQFVSKIIDDYNIKTYFDDYGLITKNMNGLYYPYNEQAKSVVQFFLNELEDVNIIYNTKVISIEEVIHTTNGNYEYDFIAMCCGSKASKQLGGNESGYMILKELGYKITDLYPSLVQVISKDVSKNIKGVRIHGTFTLYKDEEVVLKEKGEVLFTDYGLSGIAIFQMTRFIKEGNYRIEVDSFDEYSLEETIKLIKNLQREGHFDLRLLVNDKYANYLNVGHKNAKDIAYALKHRSFKVDGLNSFDNAQIVSGGLDIHELNDDCSLKRHNHIYVCGELLDVDGPCGGYNLHFAFASGIFVANQLLTKLF